MVAKNIQWFNRTGSTQNRPRHGRPKKLSPHAQRHIQRLCLGNIHMSAASIAAEVEGVGGQTVSAQTICHTLHQIGLHGCRPRRKPLLKIMHKKAWTHVLCHHSCLVFWWDQDKLIWFRWCQACVVATRWGVQRQVCLAYSQAWWWECNGLGCMSAAGTGKLQLIERTMNANMYSDILKQSKIPSLRRLGCRAPLPC